jgi:hypothetical protein
MSMNPSELEFIAAWAQEEKAANPYVLAAHRLQAKHRVAGVVFIRLIKAWARAENRRDEEIFELTSITSPTWPWMDEESMYKRRVDEILSDPVRID